MRRKKKKYFVSLGCQVEPDMFSRVKLAAQVMKVSRSAIIREGIALRLREIDEANNAMSEEFMNRNLKDDKGENEPEPEK